MCQPDSDKHRLPSSRLMWRAISAVGDRAFADLASQAQRRVALVVKGKAAPVQSFVLREHHSAVAAGDGLVLVETDGGSHADAAYGASPIACAECLCAVLDEGDAVALRNGLELVEARRIPEHMHRQDCLGARSNARLDVGRIEVQG